VFPDEKYLKIRGMAKSGKKLRIYLFQTKGVEKRCKKGVMMC